MKFISIGQLFQKMFILDDIVDEYNNTCHKTIKMKPVDIGDDSFAE